MAATKRELEFVVTGKDVGATSVFGKVTESLDKLKAGLGGRSALKDVFEVLRGGGPVSGLTFALEGITSLTERAIQLRDEFRQGKVSAGDLADQIARSVPILGQAYAAGRNIKELLDDLNEKQERQNELLREGAAAQQRFVAGKKLEHDFRVDIDRMIRSTELEISGARPNEAGQPQSDFAKRVSAFSRQMIETVDAVERKAKEAIDELPKDSPLRGEIADKRDEFITKQRELFRLRERELIDKQNEADDEAARKNRETVDKLGGVLGGALGSAGGAAGGALSKLLRGVVSAGALFTGGGSQPALGPAFSAGLAGIGGEGRQDVFRDRFNVQAENRRIDAARREQEQKRAQEEQTKATKALKDKIDELIKNPGPLFGAIIAPLFKKK